MCKESISFTEEVIFSFSYGEGRDEGSDKTITRKDRVMAEFNPYNLYCMASSQSVQDNKDLKVKELERTINAFLNFHKPETFEERQKFVNDALQGRNYNQTLEFDGETMDFEFVDNVVTVTLHSPNPGRDNKYFKYAT